MLSITLCGHSLKGIPQILMHHIRNTLPDIKARITQQLQRYNSELQSLGGPLADGNSGNIVLSVITEFTSEFRTVIDGNTNDLPLNELSGGARISFVYHELFNNGIRSIDPFDQVKDGDIRTILYNSSVRWVLRLGEIKPDHMDQQGSTPALFMGTTAFEIIVKQQIKRLEEPSLKCCQLVYDELIRILGQLLTKIASVFRASVPSPQTPSYEHLYIASFQTFPDVERAIQCRRSQLLQEINVPHDEVGL